MPELLQDRYHQLKRVRERQYYQEHKEATLARTSAYRKKHLDYYANYQREWNKTHQAERRVYEDKWDRLNPARRKLYKVRANAKRKGVPCDITADVYHSWYNKQSLECTYCGIPEEKIKLVFKQKNFWALTLDRKDNRFGYTIDNICLCCYKCNTSKSNYIPFEAMLEIGRIYLKPLWQKMLEGKEN